MDFKKSKPFTIFVIVIVAAIWINGVRVFVQSMNEDEASYNQDGANREEPSAEEAPSPAAGTGTSFPESTDTRPAKAKHVSDEPEKQKPKPVQLAVSDLKALETILRDPFQISAKPMNDTKAEKDDKTKSRHFIAEMSEEEIETDPGPGITLVGIVFGRDSTALLLSENGEKKLVRTGEDFSGNRILRINPRSVLVQDYEDRKYRIDSLGWKRQNP